MLSPPDARAISEVPADSRPRSALHGPISATAASLASSSRDDDPAQRPASDSSSASGPRSAGTGRGSASVSPVPHRIGSNEGAQHGVRPGQRARHPFVVTFELGLIVGQDHDRAPRVAPARSPDIFRRVEQPARDIGAAVKRLVSQQRFHLALDIRLVGAERQTQARGAVEHHDPDAVVFAERLQRLVRRRGDALHVRPHAAADVEQQQQVDRHVLAGEIADLEHLARFAQNEVGDAQPRDRPIVAVDHLCVHPEHVDIAAEDDFVVPGGDQGQSHGGGANQQKTIGTAHFDAEVLILGTSAAADTFRL